MGGADDGLRGLQRSRITVPRARLLHPLHTALAEGQVRCGPAVVGYREAATGVEPILSDSTHTATCPSASMDCEQRLPVATGAAQGPWHLGLLHHERDPEQVAPRAPRCRVFTEAERLSRLSAGPASTLASRST